MTHDGLPPHSPESNNAEYAMTLYLTEQAFGPAMRQADHVSLVRRTSSQGIVVAQEDFLPEGMDELHPAALSIKKILETNAKRSADSLAKEAAAYRGLIGRDAQPSDADIPPAPIVHEGWEMSSAYFLDSRGRNIRAILNVGRLINPETFGTVIGCNASFTDANGDMTCFSVAKIGDKLIQPRAYLMPKEEGPRTPTYTHHFPEGDEALDRLLDAEYKDEADLEAQIDAAFRRLRARISEHDLIDIMTEVAEKARLEKERLYYLFAAGDPPIEEVRKILGGLLGLGAAK